MCIYIYIFVCVFICIYVCIYVCICIYKSIDGYGNLLSFCSDVAQGQMKGAPNETRTHSCRFASRAC